MLCEGLLAKTDKYWDNTMADAMLVAYRGLENDFNKNVKIYKYILLDYIGGGNFGEVWRAKDLSLNTECALKLIPPNRTSVAY